jgi:hypothetical protein
VNRRTTQCTPASGRRAVPMEQAHWDAAQSEARPDADAGGESEQKDNAVRTRRRARSRCPSEPRNRGSLTMAVHACEACVGTCPRELRPLSGTMPNDSLSHPRAAAAAAASTDLGEVGAPQPPEGRRGATGANASQRRITRGQLRRGRDSNPRYGWGCPHRPVLAPPGLRASCLPQIPCSPFGLRAEWGRPSRSRLNRSRSTSRRTRDALASIAGLVPGSARGARCAPKALGVKVRNPARCELRCRIASAPKPPTGPRLFWSQAEGRHSDRSRSVLVSTGP